MVAGVAVLCCLPTLAGALPVSVTALTARQLESRVLLSQRLTFSGYAESDANFGLPALPAFSSVTPLLDGVSRMRVWQAAPDRWRVDTLSDTGENDTYQDGDSTFAGTQASSCSPESTARRSSGCPGQPTSSRLPWPCGSSMRRERALR